MSKKNIILMAAGIIIFLLILIIASTIYYFQTRKTNTPMPGTIEAIEEAKRLEQEKAQQTYNQRFPDLIRGTINIVSDSETTVKTEEKEYLIWPARPMSFYRDSEIKNGIIVQVRGKIADDNSISLGSVVPSK